MNCVICKKPLGNTYSLKLNKEDKPFYTCSYDCNCKMKTDFDEDYWKYVVNKTDFINPCIGGKNKDNYENFKEIDFENLDENSDLLMDGERYNRLYKIYLENKRIDEIMDDISDTSSNYSDDY